MMECQYEKQGTWNYPIAMLAMLAMLGLMFLPAKINFDRPAVEIGSNWYKLVLTG